MDESAGGRRTDEGAPRSTDSAPVVLPESLLARHRKFSLYNSPYPAHDRARAVDLYPAGDGDAVGSPVAGEVLDARTVGCPDREYAVDRDHLIVLDAGEHLARVLHVDPAVEAGDEVAVGDPLGDLVRSGFFGRWVDNHLHLEFRERERNPYRASGSLPLVADAPVTPVGWDGTGTVVETGASHAVLDAPRPPSAGEGFHALAGDDGRPLDGGLAHYAGGGVLAAGPEITVEAGVAVETEVDDGTGVKAGADGDDASPALSLLGTEVGSRVGRHVDWADVAVLANGERITGLSLFAARGDDLGAKLVTRPEAGDPTFAVGDEVRVRIVPDDDPVRLG
ncbi:hypothetical protein Hbl1158_14620 [Halobaculum sp. CBA1158]|uniref:hypothetical protein n=1 Tax=Halobaculum sp. CBA1158 TaxID=2904243 RepID=UPI001F405E7B|nr:hypothetical protein [Halobaculum sp. CBA1158]UIO99735.1 hypothetical protein Hbl1158_14620 [Halobaculum sp. CBA1158]